MTADPNFAFTDDIFVSVADDGDGAWPVVSEQAEMFWTPVLGPGAMMLARFVARESGSSWVAGDIFDALGVGKGPVRGAIARLVRYRLAEWDDDRRMLTVYDPIRRPGKRSLAGLPAPLAARLRDEVVS